MNPSSDIKTQLLMLLQARLKQLNYYKGNLDGDEGVMTRNAVIQFKKSHGLRPRAYVGPKTLGQLFSPNAKPAPTPKPVPGERLALTEAKRWIGTREVKGPGNDPDIMDWAHGLDQWYPGDDTPWCGLFVAHCESVGSPETPQDFNRLRARKWLNYGVSCPPMYGAIGVFWRTHPTKSENGHVAYLVGQDAQTFHILGGNQNDEVSFTRIKKRRLLGCRIPSDEMYQSTNLASVATGEISTNEA